MTKLDIQDDQHMMPGAPPRRHSRRLEDKVLIAFHHACDVNDLVVAETLLQVLESMVLRQNDADQYRRRFLESLVAAHERLWYIRHPGK